MYFNKWPHPANFQFASSYTPDRPLKLGTSRVMLGVTAYEDDVFRLRGRSRLWPRNHSLAGLTPPPKRRARKTGGSSLTIDPACGLCLRDARGQSLLEAPGRSAFGLSGESFLFVFQRNERDQFYGMGEHLRGLEQSGRQTTFWNTDVFADFYFPQISDGHTDPHYASIPYLVVKRGHTYVGLLLDNPHAAFISTGAGISIAGQMELGEPEEQVFTIGSTHGAPDLYLIVGPSLAELTRKLQRLVGLTPLPPAWALGYHQCRWGYRSAEDLMALDAKFREHKIPCDGLWLDIDYMDGFRVFTMQRDHFPEPDATLRALRKNGRRVIPIIDPGVKYERSYAVYRSGHRADAFCHNPQGREFIGLVWPGETVFPDFSLPEVRTWWARHVSRFARKGFEGCWIDMNDPSTGAVDNTDMLFHRGRDPHHTFHNQYALGMAMATRAGFEKAHRKKRTFLVSRSGSTGISRYAAVWTGDNISSYLYLKKSIACSLNLALSGVPFNGPDIGGFCGDATPQLLRDWQKACFLFPFCRNHSMMGTRDQEPWAFDRKSLAVVRHYIRLRYKLRPYLYNLFVAQSESGEAILRPLFYDFKDTRALPLSHIDDQFMVGPAILQAPLVDDTPRSRTVLLPGHESWYSTMHARWVKGGHRVTARPGPMGTPLYVREGSIIPMAPGDPEDSAFDPTRIECHLFLRRTSRGTSTYEHICDDGETMAYLAGKRTRVRLRARVRRGRLDIQTEEQQHGYKPCSMTFVLYDAFDNVRVNGVEAKLRVSSWHFCGRRQKVRLVAIPHAVLNRKPPSTLRTRPGKRTIAP